MKTPTLDEKKAGVIYEATCLACETVYIGETGRCMGKRMLEHRRAVRNGDRTNGVAVHAWDESHRVNWTGAKIREVDGKERHWKQYISRPNPIPVALIVGSFSMMYGYHLFAMSRHAPRCCIYLIIIGIGYVISVSWLYLILFHC